MELFVLEKVFIEDYIFDEEESGNYRLESLHKKRNFLAGYCKLIVYNIIPMNAAVCVIKNYVKVKFLFKKLIEIFYYQLV